MISERSCRCGSKVRSPKSVFQRWSISQQRQWRLSSISSWRSTLMSQPSSGKGVDCCREHDKFRIVARYLLTFDEFLQIIVWNLRSGKSVWLAEQHFPTSDQLKPIKLAGSFSIPYRWGGSLERGFRYLPHAKSSKLQPLLCRLLIEQMNDLLAHSHTGYVLPSNLERIAWNAPDDGWCGKRSGPTLSSVQGVST